MNARLPKKELKLNSLKLEIDEAIANELVSANAKIVKEYGKSFHLGFPIRVVDTEEKTFPSFMDIYTF